MAAGQVELMPRRRFAVDGGYFAVMAATDRGLGVAGLKSYLLVEGRIEFVVCLFDLGGGDARRNDRGGQAGAGENGRRERCGGEALRPAGGCEPRADRCRVAGGVAARRDPRGRAVDRAGRRLQPLARARRGVRGGQRDRRRGVSVGGRWLRRRGDRDIVEGSRAARRLACRRRARLRDRGERSPRTRARRAGDRPRDGRLLRLDRGRPPRVRRSHRADRGGSARLARGAGAGPDRVR